MGLLINGSKSKNLGGQKPKPQNIELEDKNNLGFSNLDEFTDLMSENMNNKANKAEIITITLPTTGWVDVTDENLKNNGAVYQYTHTTDIDYADVTTVSGIIQLPARDTAQKAGMIDIIGYDKNDDNKLIVMFYTTIVPTATIPVDVTVQ